MVRATLTRLGLQGDGVEVLLGGGMLRARRRPAPGAIREGLPGVELHTAASPPIVGAALLGLDELGAGTEA